MIGVLLFGLAGCSGSQVQAATTAESTPTQVVSTQDTPAAAATVEIAMTAEELEAAGAGAASAAQALAENSATHEDAADYLWDESAVIQIELEGNSISAGGAGVAVDGSLATITASGTYSLSGNLSDGQIIVNDAGFSGGAVLAAAGYELVVGGNSGSSGTKVLGSRDLARYYKQRPRPEEGPPRRASPAGRRPGPRRSRPGAAGPRGR